MNYQQKVDAMSQKNNSLLCVGLDSDVAQLPAGETQFTFNQKIIDATCDLVCAYKPNTAFYEALGADGLTELKKTCDYIRTMHPNIPIILDAKRGDIGSTNGGYGQFAFEYLQADAITLHSYLGREAMQPLLDYKEKGCIFLCHTSNVGADEFQDVYLRTSTRENAQEEGSLKLYQYVARRIATTWNGNNNCSVVVGATYPEQLGEVRKIVGDMSILVPGIGKQGGDVAKIMEHGLNSQKSGLILNSSRAIIFASREKDFASAARAEAMRVRDEINRYR